MYWYGILGFCVYLVAANYEAEMHSDDGSSSKTIVEEESTRVWKFRVKHKPRRLEKVCITGDCDALGNWNPRNIIPMSYDGNTKLWTLEANIAANRDVLYRYFICTVDKIDEQEKTKIKRWEPNNPRRVTRDQISDKALDKFDRFGKIDGIKNEGVGWLTDDVAVYLRLTADAIQWGSREAPKRKTFIKCLQQCDLMSDRFCDMRPIWISTRGDDGKYREQKVGGYSFYETDEAVFMSRTFTQNNQAFMFQITRNPPADDETVRNGISHVVLDSEFHGSVGSIKTPIHSADHEYLGNLIVNYVVVRPFPLSIGFTFKLSFAKYWNDAWTDLKVGRRIANKSAGKSESPPDREDTINSIESTEGNGADMIELDVQVTRDLVPVAYPDFDLLLEMSNKLGTSRRVLIPFQMITFEDLLDLKIHRVQKLNESAAKGSDGKEDTSFASLRDVLKSADSDTAFNIEIKHTTQSQNAGELNHSIDMNDYVNKILEVVFENAGDRYIVFSSFSQDICSMTRLKQNKYPVMFLMLGSSESDQRLEDTRVAIHFAHRTDLLGIVAAAGDLLVDHSLVEMILDSDLILFCWGKETSDRENVEMLKKQGVHGIIFDRMVPLGDKSRKSVFGKDSLEKITLSL